MKLCIRTLAVAGTALAIVSAGLIYTASDRLHHAGRESGTALAASLDVYRHAQALKAQAAGYELTMNEFYSTVLEYPVYQKKITAQRQAIEQELAMLARADAAGDNVPELQHIYADMDAYRLALETALSGAEKDWDRAREALFKLNVLSLRAIQQADVSAEVSRKWATEREQSWQTGLAQSRQMLHLAIGLALLVATVLVLGVVGAKRSTA